MNMATVSYGSPLSVHPSCIAIEESIKLGAVVKRESEYISAMYFYFRFAFLQDKIINNIFILQSINVIATSLEIFHSAFLIADRLCGLVVKVLDYRSGGPGSTPGTTRKKGNGSGTGFT
jgi:hypothetical protein